MSFLFFRQASHTIYSIAPNVAASPFYQLAMSGSSNKIVITSSQILESYAAHGKDCLVLNFDTARKFKDFAQYITISIRLPDSSVVGIRYWKLSTDGIMVASRFRKPEQRKYESIRMGITLCDDEGKENENVKALQVLCAAFEEKMEQLKQDKLITDNARAQRKQPDGSYAPFHLISTKVVTPMQTVAKSKETDDLVDLQNPYFWISVPKKKFYENGETPKPVVTLEDKFYVDENGQPDPERPVKTHEYAPLFFNVDDYYHDARTGKKVYRYLGDTSGDSVSKSVLDNTNIQDLLTKGSALMGNFKFEMAVSGRQCKLDVSLYGRVYVKVAEPTSGGGNAQDEENISTFADRYATIGASSAAGTGTAVMSDEDAQEDDF